MSGAEIAKVLVIGRRNRGPRSSFICLRAYGEEVWHEIYPIYCPEIKKIEVIGTMNEKIRTVRRLWHASPVSTNASFCQRVSGV